MNGSSIIPRVLFATPEVTSLPTGILNAPDPSYNSLTDKALYRKFSAKERRFAKLCNKQFIQEKLGLPMDSTVPVFFWPSRLDPVQKGFCLLTENYMKKCRNVRSL